MDQAVATQPGNRSPHWWEQALPYLLVGGLMLFFLYNRAVRDEQKYLVTQPAPSFELRALNGTERIALETLHGQPVILIFWSVRGPRVGEALMEVEKLFRQYAEKDLVCVGLNLQDSPDEAARYAEEHGLTYLQLTGAEALLEQYHVVGVPTLFVLDRQGIVQDHLTGWSQRTETQLRAQVRSLFEADGRL